MEWSEVVANKDSMIRPLYNKQWVLSTVRASLKESYGEGNDEEVDSLLDTYYDGSVVVGTPICDTWDEQRSMMFGLQSEEYLCSQSVLDEVLREMFSPLIELNIFEVGLMESVVGVNLDQGVSEKEIWNVLSYVIGESLTDPSIPSKAKISTADCKAHIKEKFSYDKMKRTNKKKMGLIEFRSFSNEDGDECTVLSYNGRIICSYPFTSSDYE